jgi:glycosyltransferase involved in cell wall biosynthesis
MVLDRAGGVITGKQGTIRHCIIIASTWSSGAVSQQFIALADELGSRGHFVIFITDKKRSPRVASPNFSVVTWPSQRPTRPRDVVFLFHVLSHHAPTCLVSSFAAVNLVTLIGAIERIRCRICWYHTPTTALNMPSPHFLRRTLTRLRKRLVYKCATHIVPVTEFARDDLVEHYGVSENKLTLWYNAVRDPVPEVRGNKTLGFEPTVACVSRYHEVKGQDILIRALSFLSPSLKFRVRFHGPGDARPLSHLADDLGVGLRCQFGPELRHDEILRLLTKSFVVVVPSRMDNCPLVIIESLAVGTPVIASDTGGIPELVVDGREGLLVPPGDPEALAKALATIVSNLTLRQQMGRNARARFLRDFELTARAAGQADWIEQILPR